MIVACPGALLVTLAVMDVCPPLMVTEGGTETIALSDEERVTWTPNSGAFAGLLLESCS